MSKIDLHTHTLDSKSEGKTRNVTKEKYYDVLTKNGIVLAAITNHNEFDLKQYREFVSYSNDENTKGRPKLNVIPGIEIDVICNKTEDKGHLILVTSANNTDEFNTIVKKWYDHTPKPTSIDLETIISDTKHLDMFYLGHFLKEHQNLKKETMEYIEQIIANKHSVFYEPSNLKKLGILINHDYRGIIGSDVKDWDKYPGEKLPSIRVQVDSFEQLFLLAKRDKQLIDTLLNKKKKIELDLEIKGDKSKKVLGNDKVILYEDLNIIFGNKGTGKSKYLSAINDALMIKGYSTKYYDTGTAEEELKGKLKTDLITRDFKLINNINDVNLDEINDWEELSPTLIGKYFDHFKTKKASQNRRYLAVNFSEDSLLLKCSHYENELDVYNKIGSFITYLNELDDVHFPENKDQSLTALTELLKHNKNLFSAKYTEYLSHKFTHDYIKIIKEETEKKTNEMALPGSTKLYEYWENRKRIRIESLKIKTIIESKEYNAKPLCLGKLDEKLTLNIKEIHSAFNDFKTKEDGYLMTLTNLKSLKKAWYEVEKHLFDNEKIAKKITDLKNIISDTGFASLNDFIGIKRTFYTEEHEEYEPSSGEAKMILLQEVLEEKSQVFLLDEPDRSLGNVYVNSVILPKLIELANQNKIVVIVTHSANLAVRSLPYCSILKDYVNKTYKTYIGNPYMNSMINVYNSNDLKDWKFESIQILEGGKEAFLERGDTYNVGK